MRRTRYVFFFILLIQAVGPAYTQVLGGSSTYNFLKLPPTPQLSALGGVNISNRTDDVGLIMGNASLLRQDLSGQVHASFNLMYAGIKNVALVSGKYMDIWKTNFGLGISYIDYGTIDATDPSGNISGTIHPRDYLVKAIVSRQYESKWHYGFALNFIQSAYGEFQSSALALDATTTYYDSAKLFQAALVLKNMGVQLKSFVPGTSEQLPFDFQIGLSKRLQKAPIQFSLTAHHLHQFNIAYNDTSSNGAQETSHSAVAKIFEHVVFATQLYIEQKIELTAGYNFLRRSELRINNTTNGLTGFTIGIGYTSQKLQLRYARAWYQNNTAYNQFGINLAVFK